MLTAVGTGRQAEVDLLTTGLGRLFPEAWARFRDGVAEADRDGDLARAYHRLLNDSDPAVRAEAAVAWCAWEQAIVPTAPPNPRYERPEFRYAFARIVTHYWANGHWLPDGAVLREGWRLAGIPGVIVQGRLDLGNLLGTPWELANAWPDGELVLVGDAGHDASSADMVQALVAATDRFT